MSFLRFRDVIDEFEHVDDPQVLERAKTNPALRRALELSRPENWRGSGLTPDQILPIAVEDGIPVARVPPKHVLREVVAAARADRTNVLLSHEQNVLEQCHTLLRECSDPWLDDEQTLLHRALQTYRAGFHEAAMALAVAVGEPLALWASEPRVKFFESEDEKASWEKARKGSKYALARLELAEGRSKGKMEQLDVLRRALIAPIPKFFAPFHGRPDEPMPDTASRHATVHRPTVRHLSRVNALLVLMLCVSILRDMQEWCEEVRMQESPYDEG